VHFKQNFTFIKVSRHAGRGFEPAFPVHKFVVHKFVNRVFFYYFCDKTRMLWTRHSSSEYLLKARISPTGRRKQKESD